MGESKIELGQVFIKNKRTLAWREIDGELIIFYIPNEDIYKANAMGLYIWNQIDGQKTLAEIISEIRAEFDVGAKVELEKDIAEFLNSLIKYDIVKAK